MKTLYLVRHAKSSWDHPGVSDFDRPLLEKGLRKSKQVIEYLRKKGIYPGLMISSPAVRAVETAKIFARGLGYPEEKIGIDRKIYDGYYDHILDIIYGTSNAIDSLMIFGHNPTITQLANLFLPLGIEDMPTSAVVGISFETTGWEEVPKAGSKQLFFIMPKLLK
ncbi:MAG: histidine phosphatase family protein [bacterium]